MKLLKIIRSIEWWEYKLPPLLAIAYATALKSDRLLIDLVPHLLFLLFALIIGAVYVSVINDITDIEVDEACGKANRMANLKPWLRWLVPFVCLSGGVFCSYYLYPDRLSVCLYIVPWISFSLYSFKPVRLKNRGIWGVIADASGSHLFISLLMISSIIFAAAYPVDWLWFASTGLWAFSYGLRGILWHQFYDRKNDIQAGLNTFAVAIDPKNFKKNETLIFIAELIAVTVMLFCIHHFLCYCFLAIYLLLAFARSKYLGYTAVLIIAPVNRPYHLLMADFYQVFLPLSLLIAAALTQPYAWTVLLVHLALFPRKTIAAAKDLKALFKR